MEIHFQKHQLSPENVVSLIQGAIMEDYSENCWDTAVLLDYCFI
jgi:phytoene/squalene synthetase